LASTAPAASNDPNAVGVVGGREGDRFDGGGGVERRGEVEVEA
jgi:hypothetical protein